MIVTVKITDNDNIGVGDARVVYIRTYPDGTTQRWGGGDTDPDGIVMFKFSPRHLEQEGEYTFTVYDVIKEGYIYDPALNVASEIFFDYPPL